MRASAVAVAVASAVERGTGRSGTTRARGPAHSSVQRSRRREVRHVRPRQAAANAIAGGTGGATGVRNKKNQVEEDGDKHAFTGEDREKKEQMEKIKEEYRTFMQSKLKLDNRASEHEEFADEIQSLLSK